MNACMFSWLLPFIQLCIPLSMGSFCSQLTWSPTSTNITQTVFFKLHRSPSPMILDHVTVNTITLGDLRFKDQLPQLHWFLRRGGRLVPDDFYLYCSIWVCSSRRLKLCKHLTTYSKPHPTPPLTDSKIPVLVFGAVWKNLGGVAH